MTEQIYEDHGNPNGASGENAPAKTDTSSDDKKTQNKSNVEMVTVPDDKDLE